MVLRRVPAGATTTTKRAVDASTSGIATANTHEHDAEAGSAVPLGERDQPVRQQTAHPRRVTTTAGPRPTACSRRLVAPNRRPPPTPKGRSSRTSRCPARPTTQSARASSCRGRARPLLAGLARLQRQQRGPLLLRRRRRTSAWRACRSNLQHRPATRTSRQQRHRPRHADAQLRAVRRDLVRHGGRRSTRSRAASRSIAAATTSSTASLKNLDQPDMGRRAFAGVRGHVRLLRSRQLEPTSYQIGLHHRRRRAESTSTACSCRTRGAVSNRLTINARSPHRERERAGLQQRGRTFRPTRSSSTGPTRPRRASASPTT